MFLNMMISLNNLVLEEFISMKELVQTLLLLVLLLRQVIVLLVPLRLQHALVQ